MADYDFLMEHGADMREEEKFALQWLGTTEIPKATRLLYINEVYASKMHEKRIQKGKEILPKVGGPFQELEHFEQSQMEGLRRSFVDSHRVPGETSYAQGEEQIEVEGPGTEVPRIQGEGVQRIEEEPVVLPTEVPNEAEKRAEEETMVTEVETTIVTDPVVLPTENMPRNDEPSGQEQVHEITQTGDQAENVEEVHEEQLVDYSTSPDYIQVELVVTENINENIGVSLRPAGGGKMTEQGSLIPVVGGSSSQSGDGLDTLVTGGPTDMAPKLQRSQSDNPPPRRCNVLDKTFCRFTQGEDVTYENNATMTTALRQLRDKQDTSFKLLTSYFQKILKEQEDQMRAYVKIIEADKQLFKAKLNTQRIEYENVIGQHEDKIAKLQRIVEELTDTIKEMKRSVDKIEKGQSTIPNLEIAVNDMRDTQKDIRLTQLQDSKLLEFLVDAKKGGRK